MDQFQFLSQELPAPERFDAMRSRVRQDMNLRVEVDAEGRRNYQAELDFWLWPGFGRVRSVSSPYSVYRGKGEISRIRDPNLYVIYRQRREDAWFRFGDQEFVAKAGDLIVADPTLTSTSFTRSPCSFELWRVPKHVLEPHLPATGKPLSLHLPLRAGLESLIVSLLDSVDREMEHLPELALNATLEHVCRLVGVACGASLGAQQPSVNVARLAQAKQLIELNLADPDLSPAQVAAKLGMSVRRLHAVFEPTGESFGQYVLRKRLEACRGMIADASFAGRSVTDIALGWGFGSLPSFYRGFRRAFGVAPGDLRTTGAK